MFHLLWFPGFRWPLQGSTLCTIVLVQLRTIVGRDLSFSVRGRDSTQPIYPPPLVNIQDCNNLIYGIKSSLPYKHFINMTKLIILSRQYYVKPYLVGKDKRSLALYLWSILIFFVIIVIEGEFSSKIHYKRWIKSVSYFFSLF